MKPDHIPELPDDVGSLLGHARTLHGPSEDVRARLRARLVTGLPPPPEGGGPRDEVNALPERAPFALPKLPLWAATIVFAAGLALGVLVARPPPETSAPGVASVPSPGAVAAAAELVSAAPVATIAPLTPVATGEPPAARAPVASSAARVADLAGERALLDVARTALARSDGANALVACEEHGRRFPSGALVEEREAIAIQALVLENRRSDAVARAERFRKRHPRSILLPAVLAAASAGPQ